MGVKFVCDHCKHEMPAQLIKGHMVKPNGWYLRQQLDKILVACSKSCALTIDHTRPKLEAPDMSKING